ncbi:MAG: DUF4380 domain-containing protein [Bacteroidota bacterium]
MPYLRLPFWGLLLILFSACHSESEVPPLAVRIDRTPTGGYALIGGALEVEVLPTMGGRISAVRFGERELMTAFQGEPLQFGSTFWLSPQSDWNWPPPHWLDLAAYTARTRVDTIEMRSPKDPANQWHVMKELFIQQADTSLSIRYTLTNISDSIRRAAPWEISRVPQRGMFVFPKGENEPKKKSIFPPVDFHTTAGLLWHQIRPEDTSSTARLSIADGSEGWLAWADQGVIWVKRFDDIAMADQAPGEGEIPFFISPPQDNFMEIEVQGAYTSLAPGESLQWTVNWKVISAPGKTFTPQLIAEKVRAL